MRKFNPFKNLKLDKEEQEIERAIEAGEFRPIANLEKEKRRYQKIAKFTMEKIRNINIRLPERDLYALKSKAIIEGLPYQTLVGSILHKYAHGTL